MGYDLDKLYEGPRSERRNKRRKVNRILNILIGLVIILIVFFGGKLIFGDKNTEDKASPEQNQQVDGKENTKPAQEQNKDSQEDSKQVTDEEEDDSQQAEETEQENPEPESDDTAVETEGDSESNVVKSIENPAWKPIGTEQSEPHIIVYDEGSTDRNEIEMAVSYATAIDRSDMIVWWLGRNGENSITATVSSKSTKSVYKVYVDWVTNEGWKPVKIEELKENDSPTYKKNNSDEENENDDE